MANDSMSELRFLGEPVTGEDLALIREVVSTCRGLSRMELANTVCELLGWKRVMGLPKGRECREFLEGLESKGMLELPEKRKRRPRGSQTAVPITDRGKPVAQLTAEIGELGPIQLELVERLDQREWFRELVGRYHYLGHRVPFGAYVRYLIFATKPEKMIVGCLQLSSAAWRMAVRDRWIGWDDVTRVRNLQQVVNNSRFLILPWVEVKNLASRVLSLAAKQMPTDWRRRYGVEPLLMETLVDPGRNRGSCYLAANWIELGVTIGRGRMDRFHQRNQAAPKRVLVYPLVADASRRLRGE